jgi:hypothetical protein
VDLFSFAVIAAAHPRDSTELGSQHGILFNGRSLYRRSNFARNLEPKDDCLMKKLLLRGGISLLGLAVVLAWWTYGPKGRSRPAESSIPAEVGVGGQKLEIEADSSCPATMRVSFEDLSRPSGQQELLNSWEKIPAGSRS